ncbi:MAG: C10 family peptidase [Victivallales bacterium]|nr:C10 family peptidase [Victivallales bacterium]
MSLPDLQLIPYSGETSGGYVDINQLILLTKTDADDDWDSPEIEQTGAHSYSTTQEYTTDDNVFLSYAVWNGSEFEANPFKISVVVDGMEKYSHAIGEIMDGWSVITSETHINLGRFASGAHNLVIRIDSTNAVEEDDETNNVYSLSFNVTQGDNEPPTYLLSSSWNQEGDDVLTYAFNRYTPDDYLTGCVSVANAQILYYWAQQGYEVSLEVLTSDSFTCEVYNRNSNTSSSFPVNSTNLEERCGITLAELNDKLSAITYDEPNSDEDGDIAAMTLAGMMILHAQAHCTYTYYSNIDFEEYDYDITSAPLNRNILLRANFNSTYVSNFNNSTWNTIRDNVLDGMPAMVSSAALAHVLVVDGYDVGTGEYHLNFGWGGDVQKEYDDNYGCIIGNGWYNAEELDALNMNYAVVNICPNYEKSFDKVISGTIVDGRDIEDIIEEFYPIGTSVGGIVIFNEADEYFLPGQKGIFIPVQLPNDDIRVSILGNLQNQTLVFTQGIEDNEGFESYDLLQTLRPDNPPVEMKPLDDGVTDVFLARSSGELWSNDYVAVNKGYIDLNDAKSGILGETPEKKSIANLNKICDVFTGSYDASVLLLTDDAWLSEPSGARGDALFLDDIYSASGYDTNEKARLCNIDEIYAGAGDDVIDMTSDRYVYMGSGMAIHGGDGDDVIWSNQGANILFGDAGDDCLTGSRFSNEIFVGGTGDDTLNGFSGDNVFCFGEDWGNDTVQYDASEGSGTLVFVAGLADYNWDEANRTFTCGDNSVTVNQQYPTLDNLTIYVGENRIYGTGIIGYEDYSDYCEKQDSSSTLAIFG